MLLLGQVASSHLKHTADDPLRNKGIMETDFNRIACFSKADIYIYMYIINIIIFSKSYFHLCSWKASLQSCLKTKSSCAIDVSSQTSGSCY